MLYILWDKIVDSVDPVSIYKGSDSPPLPSHPSKGRALGCPLVLACRVDTLEPKLSTIPFRPNFTSTEWQVARELASSDQIIIQLADRGAMM